MTLMSKKPFPSVLLSKDELYLDGEEIELIENKKIVGQNLLDKI